MKYGEIATSKNKHFIVTFECHYYGKFKLKARLNKFKTLLFLKNRQILLITPDDYAYAIYLSTEPANYSEDEEGLNNNQFVIYLLKGLNTLDK